MLGELLAARLDPAAEASLVRQLYGELRGLILEGTLAPGQRLPSSRSLAAELALARNTVIDAYGMLCGEGYLESRRGSGSYVACALPERSLHARAARPAPDRSDSHPHALAHAHAHALSRRAQAVLGEAVIADGRAFAPCVPDLSQFPFQTWQRLLSRAWRQVREGDARYAGSGGLPALREAVAAHLRLARQVRCSAQQVVIVNGAQHGLDLCATLLADEGERVLVEDPGYPGARRVFRAAGLELVPLKVDGEGAAPRGRHWERAPKLVYITPSHQFPTGTVMSLRRRRALLESAAAHGAWIIEDDYDGEFRFNGHPLASLQGIDRAQRVIYLGTFSKAMFPGLRLAYLVLPEPIAAKFARAASLLSFEGRQVTQAALAAFIGEGHFAAHVRRMRKLYGARRALFEQVWRQELGGLAPLSGLDTGMHLIATLPPGLDEQVEEAAAAAGITAQALSGFYLGKPDRHGLVLGYGAVDEATLRRQARKLARLVRSAYDAAHPVVDGEARQG